MNNLHRELAPITPKGWEEIETEAKRTLTISLGGRKIVDFKGPLGLEAGALNLGRLESVPNSLGDGVIVRKRLVQPLLELRVPFTMKRSELDAIERGAVDPDVGAVTEAARRIAAAEDNVIFYGHAATGVMGMYTGSPHTPLEISSDYTAYPRVVAVALSRLRQSGVDGPFTIALGRRCYTGLAETTTPGGYPVLRHVQELIDRPLIWAPAVNGAIVVSLRGGDFELVVGQDLSIGYLSHDEEKVDLYIQETLTYRSISPEAAVPLAYASDGKSPRRK